MAEKGGKNAGWEKVRRLRMLQERRYEDTTLLAYSQLVQ